MHGVSPQDTASAGGGVRGGCLAMPVLNAPVAALKVAAYWIAFCVVPQAKHFRPELSARPPAK